MIPQDWTLTVAGLVSGAAVTGLLAGVLLWFSRTYHHSHFRLWAWGWSAVTLYHLAGAASFSRIALLDPWHPARLALAFLLQAASFGSAVLVTAGTLAFVRRRPISIRQLTVPLFVAAIVAAVCTLVANSDVVAVWTRFFLRIGVRSLVTGSANVTAAVLIWRIRSKEGRLFGVAMLLLGLAEFHYAGYGIANMLGIRPTYQVAYFAFVDVVLFAGVAVAMVLMALADERRRTEANAAAAQEAVAAMHRQDLQFRRMIEHSSDIITVLDQDGVIQYESPSITRLLGYGTQECVGKSAFEYLHPDDLPSTFAAFQRGLASGQPTPHRFRFRHKNGAWVGIEALGVLSEDELGRPTLIINSRDCTERDRLEHQLFESQKMESIGRLAGGVAHDFNNMLTVIKGNAALAVDSLRGHSEARAEIEEILGATERAAQLTRQLLTFARRQVVAPEVIDANEAILRIDRMSRRVIGEDVEIRTTIAADPALVQADPGQFEQVLLNLMVNARDAMPSGGRIDVAVAVSVVGEEPPPAPVPGRYVIITVRDTGMGMSNDIKQHLFEPFFTTKPTGRGTGLGLATSYGIVRQAGGSLLVESEVGQGSCFSIYLPAVATSPAAPTSETRNPSPGGSEVVLVVEDEAAVRQVAVRTLRGLGYQVVEAEDGQAGLAAAERAAVQLVVTDVVMPRLGGVTMVERLRALDPELPVVFTSGYTNETALLKSLPPRSVFLQKPYSPEELSERVRALLDRPLVG